MIEEEGKKKYYAVKVVAYPKREKYKSMHDIRRPENAELAMIKLLSYFVINRRTPHIVLPMTTFNTSIRPFVNLVNEGKIDKNDKKYNEFVENYKKNKYYNSVSILISEWANKGDLLDFMKKNYKKFSIKIWKVLFFQIISVLAVIQSKFPSFRHNDLKANNVLIHKISNLLENSNKRMTTRYVINKCIYNVPNIGYQIKLWDFDFSAIPGIIDNYKVNDKWTDEINIKPIQNRYYDIHYFFNTLIKKWFFIDLINDNHVPNKIKNFINRIIPQSYQKGKYVSQRARILINDEYTTPDYILKNDPLFDNFRKI